MTHSREMYRLWDICLCTEYSGTLPGPPREDGFALGSPGLSHLHRQVNHSVAPRLIIWAPPLQVTHALTASSQELGHSGRKGTSQGS